MCTGLGLQPLVLCVLWACPDADARLQLGDCEPRRDRMPSRGPSQTTDVDPRGIWCLS